MHFTGCKCKQRSNWVLCFAVIYKLPHHVLFPAYVSDFSRSVCSRELPLGSDLPSMLVEDQTEWQRQGRHPVYVLGGISVFVGPCAAGLYWGNIRRLLGANTLTRGDHQTLIPDSLTWFMPSLWKEKNCTALFR